jgi:ribosomal protein L11 methyltransferase
MTVARDNAAANGLERQVTICAGSVPPADGPAHYDVVVANIIAKVLQELAPALTAAVAPGGRLLLSGIIEPAAIETLITFALHGFVPVTGLAEGDWRAYHLTREA